MKNLALIFAFVAVLLVPLLLRKKADLIARTDCTLVIITPHDEATRHEFSRAFNDYFFAKTGQHVRIDWRMPGGASEISRYLASEYLGAFQNYWTNTLHKPWSAAVESNFDNPKASPDDPARRAFLQSNVRCGVDLFFGGGSFDATQLAAAGRLVDCNVVAAHPELFNNSVIPQNLGGEPLWDAQGRWVGACLASFGFCCNVDSLARLHVVAQPQNWADLADPHFFGEVALADPTQSGSVGKAFEMIIQQQMNMAGDPAEGWLRTMRLFQRIAGNARYFTDSGAKIPFDVEAGDAAIGMCIDFYGRFQSEFVRKPDGSSRLQYISPPGGSSVGANPIAMLRGAPDAEIAREFIEFVISPAGQKLWNFKVGAPGGPEKYALRRLPILPALYASEFAQFRSDPEVQPYQQAKAFVYHGEWTGSLFRAIAFIVRAMCINPHDELRDAWQTLMDAHFPPEATAAFEDVSCVNYAEANGRIRETLRGSSRIEQVRLAKELSDRFRAQYRHAAELARAGR